jgi:hypothetical protein
MPLNCDGVTTPCNYTSATEVNVNLNGLIATQFGDTTPFSIHADLAPTVYVTGNASPTDPKTRNLERESLQLTAMDPYTNVVGPLFVAAADQVQMNALHMVTADPYRTPTFTLFGAPNYFFFSGAPNCNSPCVTIPPRRERDFRMESRWHPAGDRLHLGGLRRSGRAEPRCRKQHLDGSH